MRKKLPIKAFEEKHPSLVTAGKAIIQILNDNGFSAYFAGGAIRDVILGLDINDIDIATDATPEEVLALFPRRSKEVGASFGVIIVKHKGIQFEVATFRVDGVYSDRRRPDTVVYSSSPEDDVKRRDFTTGGLFYDPIKEEILDLVGGLEDISNKVIRAIGNPEDRFNEDNLRMLRAIRFAARFNFKIEEQTAEAIKKHAPYLRALAGERIQIELTKILCGKNPDYALRLMFDLGVLDVILPEIKAMIGVKQSPDHHPEGDVFEHTCLVMQNISKMNPSSTLAWGALLHDIGKPPTQIYKDGKYRFHGHESIGAKLSNAIFDRMPFSNKDRKQIQLLIRYHMKFKHVKQMRKSTLKKFLRTDMFDEHLTLHRADTLSSTKDLENYEFTLRKLEELESASKESGLCPDRLITGDDLIEAGFVPNPKFSKFFELLEEKQLDEKITTREQAFILAKSLLGSPNKSK